ncbi:hypothetical protein COL922a_009006 [Colletotrichum nupharicola]|nr:hypothetical protein COL922a_009006 [Colletotrichum nupharicola]
MERYSTQEAPKLWSAPRAVVRTPWRDATEAEPQAEISDTASQSVAGQQPDTNGRSFESQAAQIPQSDAESFLKSIIVQLRVAKEKGQIPPDVHLSNNGLTWDSMPETMKKISQLHPNIDIEKLVADDVARQAALLSKREETALQKVFVDLETARNIPHCIRPLQREVDPLAEDLAKSTIFPLLKDMSRPLATAMDTISAFVDVSRYDDEGFVKSIIRPCCILLGIEYPGSSAAGHRAIHEVDGEMGMAISEMMHLVLVRNSGNLRAAVGEFNLSNKFLPSWRFLLFKDKLMGVDFDGQRKKIWAKAFGEPYDDVVDIPSDSEMEDV